MRLSSFGMICTEKSVPSLLAATSLVEANGNSSQSLPGLA